MREKKKRKKKTTESRAFHPECTAKQISRDHHRRHYRDRHLPGSTCKYVTNVTDRLYGQQCTSSDAFPAAAVNHMHARVYHLVLCHCLRTLKTHGSTSVLGVFYPSVVGIKLSKAFLPHGRPTKRMNIKYGTTGNGKYKVRRNECREKYHNNVFLVIWVGLGTYCVPSLIFLILQLAKKGLQIVKIVMRIDCLTLTCKKLHTRFLYFQNLFKL